MNTFNHNSFATNSTSIAAPSTPAAPSAPAAPAPATAPAPAAPAPATAPAPAAIIMTYGTLRTLIAKKKPFAHTPTHKVIRSGRLVASYQSLIEVYDNGYALYRPADDTVSGNYPNPAGTRRVIRIALHNKTHFYDEATSTIEYSEAELNALPWYVAVTLFGEQQSEVNLFRTKGDREKVWLIDENGTDISDRIYGMSDPGCHEVLERMQLSEELANAIAQLNSKEQAIIRFCVLGDMKQKVLADRFGVSEVRLSTMKNQALNRLRTMLTDDIL